MKLKPDDVFLAQGTLRPDLIESASLLASSNANMIKTHHNDTQLVRQLREEVCKYLLQPLHAESQNSIIVYAKYALTFKCLYHMHLL